jgi:Protein of unknown function (DUF3551)
MAKLFAVILVAAGAMIAVTYLSRPADANEYPWCAQYSSDDGGGGRNCGFVSWEQCMETVRGMGGDCQRNLFYEGPADRPVKHARKHKDER